MFYSSHLCTMSKISVRIGDTLDDDILDLGQEIADIKGNEEEGDAVVFFFNRRSDTSGKEELELELELCLKISFSSFLFLIKVRDLDTVEKWAKLFMLVKCCSADCTDFNTGLDDRKTTTRLRWCISNLGRTTSQPTQVIFFLAENRISKILNFNFHLMSKKQVCCDFVHCLL